MCFLETLVCCVGRTLHSRDTETKEGIRVESFSVTLRKGYRTSKTLVLKSVEGGEGDVSLVYIQRNGKKETCSESGKSHYSYLFMQRGCI